MVLDHRFRVASDDGIDDGERLGFRVVAQGLAEADLVRRLAEGLEAFAHRGQFDIRGIDHGDLPDADAAFLRARPVAVEHVKGVLAAARAEHPVDHVAARIGGLEPAIGVAVAARLSFADPAFHPPPHCAQAGLPVTGARCGAGVVAA
ncbi:MAG: hypothetical protein HZY78_07830 [Burkholderiaceae bacterium]|nr:MAG: hypothetical protein HZY78_07830 [Burkholderiaceae bacterium]